METPLEISFRNLDSSPAIEARIREKVAKLEEYFGRIVSCRVVVEAEHRRHHKGNLYNVRIVLGMPGEDIVVNRSGPRDHAHEDVQVALRDAFDAARRQLEERAEKLRGEVKAHEPPLTGKVLRIFPEQDYGFVETSDGREVYFHRNSVVEGSFDDLEPGSEVRLVLAYGESPHGPQASTVKPIGKHHVVS